MPLCDHKFQVFGNYSEHCFRCGAPEESVQAWKQAQVRAMDEGRAFNEPHPYIVAGVWTMVDYRRYMAAPGRKSRITH